MITIKALNEFSKLVKEKTDGKIDIDNLFFVEDTLISPKYGLETICDFIGLTDDGCYVVTVDFVEGGYLKDTFRITSFSSKSYKSSSKFIEDVADYCNVTPSILSILLYKNE